MHSRCMGVTEQQEKLLWHPEKTARSSTAFCTDAQQAQQHLAGGSHASLTPGTICVGSTFLLWH